MNDSATSMEVGPGWRSVAAIEAERRGLLTRAMLISKGCPKNLLDALPRAEWHHVWKNGRVGKEYYWTERQVIRAARRMKHDRANGIVTP